MSTNPLASLTQHQANALIERTRRKLFLLDMIRSQPHQDAFFKSQARELLLRGGNRSGKTFCASMLFAAIAMDKEITLSDGTKVRARRPHQIGKRLTMWVIGYDSKHIGQTIHRVLFRAQETLRMIRDEKTRQWRTLDFTSESDLQRQSESRPAPPLIPERFVDKKSWVWEKKGSREFQQVTIVDPVTREPLADIFAYTSKGDPKAGDAVDAIWIDEKIEYSDHYTEWKARLGDKRGRLFWSSWPASDNDALRDLTARAAKDREEKTGIYEEVVIRFSDNMQFDPKGKAEQLASFSAEERIARDSGEYLLEGLRMYPLFAKDVQCAFKVCEVCKHVKSNSCSCQDTDDRLAKFLRSTNGQPSPEWTRELVLDPGTGHPGVIFGAIPPPEYGDYLVVYDELYPGRKDAMQLAPLIKAKFGNGWFYRFIIDHKAGAQQGMGYSLTVADNYAAAFKKFGISSNTTGNNFQWGSSNVGGRIMTLQGMMHMDLSGKTKIRIVTERCPHLCQQLTTYMKAKIGKEVIDDRPAKGQNIDLAVALEYWAASSPKYIKPPASHHLQQNAGYKWFQEHIKKQPENNSVIGPQYTSVG